MRLRSVFRMIFALGFAVSCVLCSMAATYRVPTDDVLIRKASVVVRGRVIRQNAFKDSDGGIYTDVTISVERVLKGGHLPPSIVVRQPGGVVGTEGEYYPGIGSFAPDERVLLILDPKPRGLYGLTDFALGKFHIGHSADGTEFLRRDGLQGALVLGGGRTAQGSELSPSDPDRDAAGFERYVIGIVHGVSPRADYSMPRAGVDTERAAEFTFLGDPPARWSEFDASTTVTYKDNSTGDSGSNCPTGCHDEVASGIVVWNGAQGANILLAYGGTDATIGNKRRVDLNNQIQFNDPQNEIANLQNCGGTLAMGGFSYFTSSGGSPSCPAMGNPAFAKISKGRILINNGVGTCLNSCEYVDMIAHETGHTIGAGHSADPAALMFPNLNPGQCGMLGDDDVAFADCVYPQTVLGCNLTALPASGEHPLSVTFNAAATAGKAPYTYDYDFGDGTSDTASAPTHSYLSPATFPASVTVTDSENATCNDTVDITVLPCTPPVTTSARAKGTTLVRAIAIGTGFKRGAVLQIEAAPGGGFVSAPFTVRKSKKKVVGKDVGAIWPVGVPVMIRVLSPTGCPSIAVAAMR